MLYSTKFKSTIRIFTGWGNYNIIIDKTPGLHAEFKYPEKSKKIILNKLDEIEDLVNQKLLEIDNEISKMEEN